MFKKIDMESWERKEHFKYYRNLIKTNYSIAAEIDITKLREVQKREGLKFFPTMLYCVIRAVNENKEFRMAFKDGELGYWDYCIPSYTIFHKDDNTFSDIWSEYSEDFNTFYKNVVEDIEKYRDVKGIKAKERKQENFCPISFLPWLSFKSVSSDTYTESNMFFPVITVGKYFEKENKIYIPISVFVNHAVADGWHTCKLINDIERISQEIPSLITT